MQKNKPRKKRGNEWGHWQAFHFLHLSGRIKRLVSTSGVWSEQCLPPQCPLIQLHSIIHFSSCKALFCFG